MQEDKTCTRCKKTKNRDTDFSPNSSWCKECRRLRAKAIRLGRKAGVLPRYFAPHKTKSEPDKYMYPEQWPDFINEVKEEGARVFFDLLQSCGLRVHEGLVLDVSRFNFKDGTVRVETLKQKDGIRPKVDLFVRPDLLAKIRLGFDTHPSLFPHSYDHVLLRFKQAAKKIGLSEKLAPHSLRHLFGSRINQAGATTAEIGIMLRHRPKSVTEVYIHIDRKRRKDLMERTWKEQPHLWES